jgi:hypothetical protein
MEYSKKLSARERKALDLAVDQYRIDLSEEIAKTFEEISERRRAENKSTPTLYPLSPETEALILGIVLGRVQNEVYCKHFDKFKDSYSSIQYIEAKIRLGTDSNKELTLGTALVPLLVSKAEEFISALVRAGLTLFPRGLGEPPSVPNTIIIKYQQNISSSDILRWQVDQQVADFMKQSPNEWRKQVERWAKIDLADLGADWDMLNEMIQRRHAIVHNGGRADMEYLDRVAPRLKHGLYLGSSLSCNFAYVEPMLVELETWATCLALRWSKKFFKGVGFTDVYLMERVARLEDNGRWTQGLAILDSYLMQPLPIHGYLVGLARVNRWYCLQELGRENDSMQREIRTWQPGESAGPADVDYVEIGRWALLRDYDRLSAAAHKYYSASYNRIEKRALRDMPLIKRAMWNNPKW